MLYSVFGFGFEIASFDILGSLLKVDYYFYLRSLGLVLLKFGLLRY